MSAWDQERVMLRTAAMSYDPRPDQLDPAESRFLELVAPMGLDWRTTRAEFEARHGRTPYRSRTTIALPPTRSLSDTPLVFRMYTDWGMDLPPEHLFADCQPGPDLERQLAACLGPPLSSDTAASGLHRWLFGVFCIELRAKLISTSSVSLRSTHVLPFPDASLDPLAQLLPRAPGEDVGHAFSFADAPEHTLDFSLQGISPRVRRHPRSLAGRISKGWLAAWKDDARGRIGISAPEASLVFERRSDPSLLLAHVLPAKGPGYATLTLRATSPQANDTVLFGADPDDLNTIAERITRLWDLPLAHDTFHNC
jgi:hypothetical protein